MKWIWLSMALVIAGCGGGHWTPPAKTTVQLEEDQAFCRSQSEKVSSATGSDTVMEAAFRQQGYEDCLLERGWFMQDSSESRASRMARNQTITEQSQRIQELEDALAKERIISEQARQIQTLEAELEGYRNAQPTR